MKALVTTFPAPGHLLPLARAAVASGDEAVVAAALELHETVPGPAMRSLAPGVRADALAPTIALFTTVRADASFGALLEPAAEERSDVLVAEAGDFRAPVAAAAPRPGRRSTAGSRGRDRGGRRTIHTESTRRTS